ncbi:MAG: hypothetical protein ACFCUQ_21955 [Kiloniellales bacterium]
MKFIFIGYMAIALGVFIWSMFASEYFAECDFNDGSCTTTVADHSFKALVWPAYVVQ